MTDDFVRGLITGLAMQPLCVITDSQGDDSQQDKLPLSEKTERWSVLQPYVGALQISSEMNKEVT